MSEDLPIKNTIDDGSKDAHSSELATWAEQDLLLRNWITGTLSENALYLVVGCTSSKELWYCLEDNYL